MLNRDQILGADDLAVEKVAVPEWGDDGVVHVRTLTALEAEGIKGITEKGNFFGRFAALVLCDEEGHRLFGNDDAHAQQLGKKNHLVLARICEAAQELNGMTEQAQGELKKK